MSGTIDWDPGDALIFTQVVASESFTAAARSLDLPKSTVSRRVSRLEERLGVQLLRRTTRRLSLTDAGRAFHACAARAGEALQAAERAVSAMHDEPRGRLRVTAPVELGTRTFEVLLAYAAACPEVQLELELTNRYVNLIEEGFDVALRGGKAPEGALTGRQVERTEILVVAGPRYLRERGVPQRVSQLSEHDCVLFPSWTVSGSWTLTGPGDEKTSVAVQGRLTVNNLEGVRRAAISDLGIALVPESHCREDLAAGRLQRVLPQHCMRGDGLWVVYSRTRFLSAKVRAFADHMQAGLAKGG